MMRKHPEVFKMVLGVDLIH